MRKKMSVWLLAAAVISCVPGLSLGQRAVEDHGRAVDLDRLGAMAPEQAVRIGAAVVKAPGDAAALRAVEGGGYARLFEHRPGKRVSNYMLVYPKRAVGLERVGPLMTGPASLGGRVRIKLPEGVDPNAMAAFLMSTGDYEIVEPDWLVEPAVVTPNDPRLNSSGSFWINRIDLPEAWAQVTGAGVTVAVVDSGIDLDHPDLESRLVEGYNSSTRRSQSSGGEIEDINTTFGHGTFVGGLMAAQGNNGVDLVGVGWDFDLMPIRASEQTSGSASLSSLLRGAEWAAANGARVVNVSFSGVTAASVQATGAELKSRDALLFWSAGNDSFRLPAEEHPDVVVVGSTTSSDALSGFSNFGGMITLVAPGSSVRSTALGGGTRTGSGTSFASPIAAGVAALMMSANPSLDADTIQQLLRETADDLGESGEDDFFGSGRVNAFKAVQAALNVTSLGLPVAEDFEAGTFGPAWVEAANAELAEPPVESAERGSSARLVAGSVLTSELIRSSPGVATRVRFDSLDRGASAGDALLVEYFDESAGGWTELMTIRALSPSGRERFAPYVADVPPVSADATVRLRFSAEGSGEWYVDDVLVDVQSTRAVPPMFESASPGAARLSPVFSSSTASVVPVSGAADGAAIDLSDGAVVGTSVFESTGAFTAEPLVRFDYLADDVPAGETLEVRFDHGGGSDVLAASIVSDGSGGGFKPFEVTLPSFVPSFFGFNEVVIRPGDGASGEGRWLVDEVFIGTGYPAPAAAGPCSFADVAETAGSFGTLDGNDIAVFVQAFLAGDLSVADVAATNGSFGTLDGSDIAVFVQGFLSGCS